jgi:hypothetical protein
MKGLSRRNLFYMRAFAPAWAEPIVQQPVAQLPWGHITVLRDKESQDKSLEALQSENAPDARSVVRKLDGSDALDDPMVLGSEIVAEELVVEVIPQTEDEFTCYSCFLVRHRSQIAHERNGHAYCVECEG